MDNERISSNEAATRPGEFGRDAAHAVDEAGRNVRAQFNGMVDYFRENGIDDVVEDATRFMRSHPTQALIGAIALGFIAGRMARRS